MVKNETRIAIIPARGGSKRIPRKNLRPFAGMKMIEWPIRSLLETELFDSVFVSTEDSEIAEVAEHCGAAVLHRSEALADDLTPSTAVLQDALLQLPEEEGNIWVYMVYPTTPADREIISDFVHFTESKAAGFTVSVSRIATPMQRALRMNRETGLSLVRPRYAQTRTQDLEPLYLDAGKLYGGRKLDWLRTDSPLLDCPRGFELPDWLSVDMDTIEDWELAEYKFNRRFED